MEVQCTDQNQLCEIKCGGASGGCALAAGYLQLKVLDSQIFGNGTGAVGACPKDSSSPAGSDALADCRCNTGYTGPDGGECAACVAGTYKDATGSAECTLSGLNLARLCGSDSAQSCPTSVSSDLWDQPYYQSFGRVACSGCEAVDGSLGDITHTQNSGSTNPWWGVDLEVSRVINVVRVYNRDDCRPGQGCGCCNDRLEGFEIRVGETDSWSSATVCASGVAAPEYYVDVPCEAEGRYLFVVLPGSGKILSLKEVEVMSSDHGWPCSAGQFHDMTANKCSLCNAGAFSIAPGDSFLMLLKKIL